MKITVRNIANPLKGVTFTWGDDLETCNYLATEDVSPEELKALVFALAHEGKSVAGWTTEIK